MDMTTHVATRKFQGKRSNTVAVFFFYALKVWFELAIAKRSFSARSMLRKIAAQAAVYQIWKQRNNLLHNQISMPPEILFKEIDREVRNSISARRSRKAFRHLMIRWIR